MKKSILGRHHRFTSSFCILNSSLVLCTLFWLNRKSRRTRATWRGCAPPRGRRCISSSRSVSSSATRSSSVPAWIIGNTSSGIAGQTGRRLRKRSRRMPSSGSSNPAGRRFIPMRNFRRMIIWSSGARRRDCRGHCWNKTVNAGCGFPCSTRNHVR